MQCDFPIVYASGVNGVAGPEPDELAEDLGPLFETIVSEVPAPSVDPDAPTQILVTNLDYDEHKGRVCIGRVTGGSLVSPPFLTFNNGPFKAYRGILLPSEFQCATHHMYVWDATMTLSIFACH